MVLPLPIPFTRRLVLKQIARQGMVIFVPPGDQRDPTRSPAFYDPTFHYLRDLGIPEIG
jgi:hypothetical protein